MRGGAGRHPLRALLAAARTALVRTEEGSRSAKGVVELDNNGLANHGSRARAVETANLERPWRGFLVRPCLARPPDPAAAPGRGPVSLWSPEMCRSRWPLLDSST